MPKPMKEREFYCVKCRARVVLPAQNICLTRYKNKNAPAKYVPALMGECHKCATRVSKFVPRNMEGTLLARYGEC